MTNKDNIIVQLKEAEQDYEFYPTTDEIIRDLHKSIGTSESYSLLDIGAGNGKVFTTLESLIKKESKDDDYRISIKKYAMEKSEILIQKLDKSVFVIGTDFTQQTIIDKKVDGIFCNPPYSEYSQWAEKIIKEANAQYIYLVIPDRWENQENIKAALKLRGLEESVKIIGKYDFLNSEDRKARAKVHLIKITLKESGSYYRSDRLKTDPFKIWFKEEFQLEADKETKEYEYEYVKQKKEDKLKNKVASKKNLILNLEEFYKRDMEKLYANYKALETMDKEMFVELGIELSAIKEGLQLKIKNLKYRYWKELFNNLTSITDRLTEKSRSKLLDTLMDNTTVDFTASNAYSIVIWAIKNCNQYLDDQLVDLYYQLSDKQNVLNYKSNIHLTEDSWRYCHDRKHGNKELTHYALDYRIVHEFYSAFPTESYKDKSKLTENANNFILDVFTIAKNLGFKIDESPYNRQWHPGKKQEFMFEVNGSTELFGDIKAHKNGNMHFRLNQKFMKKFNLEAARINKWIKSPKEASEEFDISLQEAIEMYKQVAYIPLANVNLMIEGN